MIVLFTDFGLHGPYAGQMKAVLHQTVTSTSIIDLFADAPVGNPKASAYLLAVYAAWFPAGTVFLCVADPGVGGARYCRGRKPLVCQAGQRFVRIGPVPCRRDPQLEHRLETGGPLVEFSRARPLCTGCSHAGTRGAAPRPAMPGWHALPLRLAGRPLRDRVWRFISATPWSA